MQQSNSINNTPKPLIIILLTLMSLISLYLILTPLDNAPQTQAVSQPPELSASQSMNYDESLGYKIITKFERNLEKLYYVQGFKFKNSSIIAESAGLYGESEIHYMDTKTLKIVQKKELESKYFGEGCAFYTNSQNEEEIHQLTWRERKVIIYDANDLTQKRIADLPKQMGAGWGLATVEDKEPGKSYFLATDGSSYLFHISPEDWSIQKSIQIRDDQKAPIQALNDLDVIGDKIFVNLYLSTKIIELELQTGKYVRSYDFRQLKEEVFNTDYFKKNKMDNQYCLNGIAYDKNEKKIWITGKKWPFIYEVEFDNLKQEI